MLLTRTQWELRYPENFHGHHLDMRRVYLDTFESDFYKAIVFLHYDKPRPQTWVSGKFTTGICHVNINNIINNFLMSIHNNKHLED